MSKKSLLKVLSLVIVLGMLVGFVPMGATAKNSVQQVAVTVDQAVLEGIRTNGSGDYYVNFANTVDLAPAYGMSWEDRGWYVYDTLKAQADASQAKALAYLAQTGLEYEAFWINNSILVKKSNLTVLNALQLFPGVQSISAPKTYKIYDPEIVSAPEVKLAIEPNISHVQAPQAWALGFTGEGMTVANIDTGVRYTHQALVNKYRGNAGGGSFNHDYNWFDPYNTYTAPADANGHGSHTMGTMVGDDGAANQIGIAPGAKWMACRGCSTSSCTDAALLACGQFVVAPTPVAGGAVDPSKRANAVNNSWGDCGRTYDSWYQATVDAWLAAGVYPVFSNGNASNCDYPTPPGLNTVGNPARSGNVTGVGSSGQSNGAYATHSNWGPTDNLDTVNPVDGFNMLKPQVIAPGTDIRSSVPSSDTAYQGGWSGTSMSAPHVTGLVAMMWQAAPCLVGDYAATESLIEQTATHITYNDGSPLTPTDYPNFATGWGEINALAAVQAASSSCGTSIMTGTVATSGGTPIANALIELTGTTATNNRRVRTNAAGVYTANINPDTYSVTASAFGFTPQTIADVVVADGATVTQDFVLVELPNTLVSGIVTDGGVEGGAAQGIPLYAKLSFTREGTTQTVYTDPFTGEYSLTIYNTVEYSVTVESVRSGWSVLNTTYTAPAGLTATKDFELFVNASTCSAPGYAKSYFQTYNFEATNEGFTSGGTNSSWAWGTITSGPGTAHGGTKGIATNPAGDYNTSELSWMASPVIDLSAHAGKAIILEYWNWLRTESATYTWDVASFQATKDGTTWTTLWGPSPRQDSAWWQNTIKLDSSYATNKFQFRFYFKSDSSGNTTGWYIDDIGIALVTAPPATAVVSYNFDDATGSGFVAGGVASSWALGTPTTGPNAARSAPNVWATNLAGDYNSSEKSYITSPVIDASAHAGKAITINYHDWLYTESASDTGWDRAELYASKDGGTTFTELKLITRQDTGTNYTASKFELPVEYSVSNLVIRFGFKSDSSVNKRGWYIDDVSLTAAAPLPPVPCEAQAGSYATGYVFDANFPTNKLIGAKVATDLSASFTATVEADPDHGGTYFLFQPFAGDPVNVAFTASMAKYADDVATLAMHQKALTRKDFFVKAGLLTVVPSQLERTIFLHDDPETTMMTLKNEGGAPLDFKLSEIGRGFSPLHIPAFTGTIESSGIDSSIDKKPAGNAPTFVSVPNKYGITSAPAAYGIDATLMKGVYWADLSVPGTWTVLGTAPASTWAGDFLGDDFTKMYVVSEGKYYIWDIPSDTFTLQPPVTFPAGLVHGLTGARGIMYGIAGSTLFTFDPETREVITIGDTGLAGIIDLAYVPDNELIYVVDRSTDKFYSVNPETAVATVIGSLGVDASYAQGMDYDEVNKIMYWAACTPDTELRVIDLETGASTLIGKFPDATNNQVDAYSIVAYGGAGVPWLDEAPLTGTIPANGSVSINVEFNVYGIEQPGDYFAELRIKQNTPYVAPVVPVTMHVARPFTWGNIKGDVYGFGKCDENPTLLKKADVNFYKDGALVGTTKTNDLGYYSYSLLKGTYDVEVIAVGQVTMRQSGVVVAPSDDVTVPFTLRHDSACLKASQLNFYAELNPDGQTEQTLTFTNTGAREAVFELFEVPGVGPIPFSDFEFVLDDGVSEDGLGLTSQGQFLFFNRFTPADDIYPFNLEQVQVLFRDSVPTGDEVQVLVWRDDDDNPANGATLLYSEHFTVQFNDNATFNVYDLSEPVLVDSGPDLLIGIIHRASPSAYPAAIDENNPQARSWVAFWTSEPAEEPDLSTASTIDEIGALGFPGNMTIRGYASSGNTDIPWLLEDPTASLVAPNGGTVDVTLSFDATGLTWGDYFGKLTVKNAPDPKFQLDVQLRVLPIQNIFLPLIIKK